MIDRDHDLPICRQATVLGVSRGAVYYKPRPTSAADLKIMRRLDELHLDYPFAGSRMLRDLLRGEGIKSGRQRVARMMKRMGIEALYRRPNTSKPASGHSFSRRVLSWRVSITMEVEFCLEAVEEALTRHGRPEIFNTDQGSQFTSADFTGLLLDSAIAISMDGKGAWRDNVFVERLWRSVKYEEVYLRAYDSVGEARASIGRYLDFYNRKRPHSSLDARTPDRAYFEHQPQVAAA
jgi:putative transposase